MKIDTDAKKIERLLTRGVENIYPKKDFLEARLKEGKQLTLYTGYDPTAPTLHIGHGITMLKLREFQDLGHKIIMLIGDFTGMIGDPTDKGATRKQLTRKEVLENCKNYKKQSSAILNFEGKNPVEVKYNSAWLGKLSFYDILELSSHFTVSRLLERDMFANRIKEGGAVHLHEFMYPIMQAYDSVAMNVDGEIGGNDQTFNMLAGRDLLKELKNKEKFVLTMKLLTDTTGKKMGKSEGNMIALNDSPKDMFGKVMSWPDEFIARGFELCTTALVPSVEEIKSQPMKQKLALAYEITKTFLGEKSAKIGEESFKNIIQDKDRPTDMPEVKPSVYEIAVVLMESKICKSKSEARQIIDQGGVKINDVKVSAKDYNASVKKDDIVQKGSRFFARVK